MTTRDELLAIAQEPNVAAFLHVIRFCEGTLGDRGFQTIYGYQYFDSFADHPRKKVTAGAYTSSAAGAFQFMPQTWDEMRAKYALPDFSPASQIAGAVGLLIRRGALDAIRAGDLDRAVDLTNEEWASLPGSPYGQPTRTMAQVREQWQRALTGAAPIVPRTQPTSAPSSPAVVPSRTEVPMSPFILPALDILARAVPTIAELFKGEQPSKVAERNVEAVKVIADKVIPLVVAATGAPNVQAAAEAAQADPKVAGDIDAAARREYHELSQVSLREAREFGMAYSQLKDVRTVVGNFTFIEFLSLVLLAMSAGFGIALLNLGLLKGELLGAIVMLVVVAGFVEVRKYWLGLPAPEPKDTQR